MGYVADRLTLWATLATPTIVGRLLTEDPSAPSAILLDLADGTPGAAVAQVAVATPDQARALVSGALAVAATDGLPCGARWSLSTPRPASARSAR